MQRSRVLITPAQPAPHPIRIAVCYHAFFFGSFYFLFSIALAFKLAWCGP